MEKAIQLLKNFFEKEDWNYSFNEEKSIFTTGINMNGALGNLHIIIRIRETSYTVYTILNSNAEEDNIAFVAEYLHRANYGLRLVYHFFCFLKSIFDFLNKSRSFYALLYTF